MNVTTCKDQAECAFVLDHFQIREVFKPLPPALDADGIIQMDSECWLVGSNERGRFTLYFLEGATNAEAWAFFDRLNGGCGHTEPRVTVCGAMARCAGQN